MVFPLLQRYFLFAKIKIRESNLDYVFDYNQATASIRYNGPLQDAVYIYVVTDA